MAIVDAQKELERLKSLPEKNSGPKSVFDDEWYEEQKKESMNKYGVDPNSASFVKDSEKASKLDSWSYKKRLEKEYRDKGIQIDEGDTKPDSWGDPNRFSQKPLVKNITNSISDGLVDMADAGKNQNILELMGTQTKGISKKIFKRSLDVVTTTNELLAKGVQAVSPKDSKINQLAQDFDQRSDVFQNMYNSYFETSGEGERAAGFIGEMGFDTLFVNQISGRLANIRKISEAGVISKNLGKLVKNNVNKGKTFFKPIFREELKAGLAEGVGASISEGMGENDPNFDTFAKRASMDGVTGFLGDYVFRFGPEGANLVLTASKNVVNKKINGFSPMAAITAF